MLNVVATLQQYCGNVLITSKSNAVTTSETNVGTTLIFGRNTTLWQRQQLRCDNVVTTSLCQLGGRFRLFLARCRSFQVVSGRFRLFRVLVSTLNLFESPAKISKSSKLIVQLHCHRWAGIVDWLTFLRILPIRLLISMRSPYLTIYCRVIAW